MRFQRQRSSIHEPGEPSAPDSLVRRALRHFASPTVRALIRRLAALALLVAGFFFLKRALQSGHMLEALGYSLFALGALWMPAVCLTLPDTLPFANRLVSKIFTSVYMPGHEVPPLDYELARRMVKRREHTVAIREYLKILEYYPKEFDAYRELIQIGMACEDPDFSREILQRAFKRLPSSQQREALRAEFPNLAN